MIEKTHREKQLETGEEESANRSEMRGALYGQLHRKESSRLGMAG